jgi:hemoglobin-like flavoprotein
MGLISTLVRRDNSGMNADEISKSLELAAERGGDIAPRVYALVFAQHPEMEALFWRDKNGSVRGEMLARLLDVIFDVLGANHYGSNLLRSEIVTHEGYGVPRDVFPKFIDAVSTVVRELCGADWTAQMDSSWTALSGKLHASLLSLDA